MKRFAVLKWHRQGRYSTLLGFVDAINAPDALYQARDQWPLEHQRQELMARHGWGDASDPNYYTNAPKYREGK